MSKKFEEKHRSNHALSVEPKLRFKEFNDSWKIRSIGDISDIIVGATPINKEKYWNGDINWFTSHELSGKKYLEDSEQKITEEGLKNSPIKKLLPKYTVLLSIRSNIGERAIIKKESCTNQGILSLVLKDDYSYEFIYYLTRTIKNRLDINSMWALSKHISKDDVKKIEVTLPSLKEQDKIADFLLNMDKNIDLREERLNLLKKSSSFIIKEQYKNLSDYDEVKLGDITNVTSSKLSHRKRIDDKGKNTVHNLYSLAGKSDSYQIDKEYISLVKDGRVGEVKLREPYSTVSHTMLSITPKKGYDLNFLYFYMKNINFKKYAVGVTIPHLIRKDFSNMKIHVPPLELQEKIGSTFRQFENSIELLEKEISLLKEYRDSIILQMLVIKK